MASGTSSTGAQTAPLLRFQNLSRYDFLTHAITTRHRPDGAQFNLALHVGFDPDETLRNRAALCAALGFPPERLTCCEQVHGARVALVDASNAGRGALRQDDALRGFDAMITAERGVPLAVFSADCALTLLADPANRAIGVCHSGWRGLACGALPATIAAMKRYFNSMPGNLLAGIGPLIEQKCYEVDNKVAKEFSSYANHLTSKPNQKYFLDLRGVAKDQLTSAGLNPANIESMDYCTHCRSDLFFSYRRDGSKSGRIALVAGLI